MPYQTNSAENIESITTGDLTKIEESIFRFTTPDDDVISQIIGNNNIGTDASREFLELHFYTRGTNELVKSVVSPLTEGYLYIRDSDSRRMGATAGGGGGKLGRSIQLGLEFWNPEKPEDSLYEKYLKDLPPDTYNVLINFFALELGPTNHYSIIGQHSGTNWKIGQISESRRELILEPISPELMNHPNNEYLRTEFEQFVDSSISAQDFKLFMVYLFDRYRTDDDHYQNIINLFFSILRDQHDDAYNDIFVKGDPTNQLQIRTALKNILEGVYSDFMGNVKIRSDGTVTKGWIDEEVNNHRSRITRNRFEQVLQAKVYENSLVHMKDFPKLTRFLSR